MTIKSKAIFNPSMNPFLLAFLPKIKEETKILIIGIANFKKEIKPLSILV